MSADGSGNSLFDGYEAYRGIDQDHLKDVLKNGTVALDTNVLLDLYRYGKVAREQIFSVLSAISSSGSLFMPAQVQREFWRRRDDVVREMAALNSVAGLREARKKAIAEIGSWGKRTMAISDADKLAADFEEVFKKAISQIGHGEGALNLRGALKDVEQDPIVQKLLELFDKRVGSPYSSERFAELVSAGCRRFESKIPPGYMDAAKSANPEAGTGDYLLWEQLIERATGDGKDVLLVTRDSKEDWWRLDADGEPIGPRVELIHEMMERASVRLVMAQPGGLLSAAADAFSVDVDESTLDDAARFSEEEEAVSVGWDRAAFESLLCRLVETGNEAQATVLGEASRTPMGFVTRSRVYEIGGYDQGRLLVGFTRPIQTAIRALVSSGELPDGIEFPLHAKYSKPGKADGFFMPRSVTESLSRESPLDPPSDDE
ncbi:PIN-like domain-containing protein [Pilimelia columellifera]|uniref:PIN like domain-containing protein n=1 Tax=Pilimelia columellifera subsp. columellifera TaxID=706583 RepID=A0ABP6A3D3_9ACTN